MITGLVDAKVAREMTQAVINNDIAKQVEAIAASIGKAAENGSYEIYWYQSISPNVREYILSKGYHIHDYNQCNESYTTIDWRNNI